MTEFNTQFRVPTDHPCLPGHFPGHPIVPGVVLLDCVLECLRTLVEQPLVLRAIVSAKFLQAIAPNMAVDVNINLSDAGSDQMKARFTAMHANALAFEGSFLLDRSPEAVR